MVSHVVVGYIYPTTIDIGTCASIGEEVLQMGLETYQTSRSLQKRGIVELELP